ncbi:MAG: acyloxyacyl hydrolase [Bacteroidales bacterium]|jgi:hypothetical protein|nr:acyloxyacyl hydrolase [Bacteroidales bacterium]MCU0410241.1 acyloxyacyl hydrolase [Bacteroidales bacterium]
MRTRTGLLVLLLFCQVLKAADKDTTAHSFVYLQGSYGFIIPHSKAIEPVSDSNPFGFELSLSKLHTSYNSWLVFHSYWISGIQAAYYNFQNPSVLGSALSVSLFAEPVMFRSERFLFTLRGGAGVSYQTEYYDEEDNPTNQFFSTPISFQLYVSAKFRYKVIRNVFISLSGNYNHISNGAVKQPNYGMNFPMLALGAEYSALPFPALSENHKYSLGPPAKNVRFSVQLLTALKVFRETETFPEKRVFVAGFNLGASKQIGHIYSLNTSAELLFDGYVKEQAAREGSDADYKRFSLAIGQAFTFGHVIFAQSLGVYLYSPYEAPQPVYQKYDLGYMFRYGIMAGVHMKAYLKEADYMGFSVTWVINGKK